jgi:hypothetical protein
MVDTADLVDSTTTSTLIDCIMVELELINQRSSTNTWTIMKPGP